jgi:ribosome-binding protein aMBF1 (putative translation factor)
MAKRHAALTRFGGNVREKREARNLSQEVLAEQADRCARRHKRLGRP